MSVIQVAPESLYREADKLLDLKDQQEAEIRKLRNLVNSLNSQWKGRSQTEFVNKFYSMDYAYRMLSELLEAYADLMKIAAEQFQSTDRSLKNQIRYI